MKVFKFGGASVKDASAVKNVGAILRRFPDEKIIVVISAMGKTTNALERLADAFFHEKPERKIILQEIKTFHLSIMKELFPNANHPIHDTIENTFVELEWAVEGLPEHSFDHEYDQIVSIGEVLSTQIVAAYLNDIGLTNAWLDARGLIQTDNSYRQAKIDFIQTEKTVNDGLRAVSFPEKISRVIVQGFIGGTSENFTTTLGREGSDYTAAVMAYCTNADSVTIWKDVPGVLNADPKWFTNTVKISELSYQDAIELTYYGATVIHPKTIKPLQNKNIPLLVKSFVEPDEEGTVIAEGKIKLPTPSFIFKVNQMLISLQPKDFSFIAEENLGNIFLLFHKNNVSIHMMQLSAINFSVCVDSDASKITDLLKELQNDYKVLYNDQLELCTIRYYDQDTIERVTKNKLVLLEQKSRYTVQLVMRNVP
jgi:aspartate kinase